MQSLHLGKKQNKTKEHSVVWVPAGLGGSSAPFQSDPPARAAPNPHRTPQRDPEQRAARQQHCWQRSRSAHRWRSQPGGGIQLEGEDDVAAAAHLADEAPLRAQLTAVDVVRRKLDQREQEGLEGAVGDLQSTAGLVTRRQNALQLCVPAWGSGPRWAAAIGVSDVGCRTH